MSSGTLPLLQVREWSVTSPDTPGVGTLLRGLTLTDADRELLRELGKRSSVRVTELRQGLSLSVGPHVGTITLSALRVVIVPKLHITHLLRMVAYAFDLSDLIFASNVTRYEVSGSGLIDLLGMALLEEVEKIARSGGILPNYQMDTQDLAIPRGRLEMRHIATHPRRATLRCVVDELTFDHPLNQVMAAGLRLASRVMHAANLRLELARAADRLFGELTRVPLSSELLARLIAGLDRRSSHYRASLTLIELIHSGAQLSQLATQGRAPLSSFLLDMNLVFERFLGRHLTTHTPRGVRVNTQEVRGDVFGYMQNAARWRRPTIRPDFVIWRGDEVLGVADAKYKNRHEHPPSSAELYQLTTYGLSYALPAPREVLLLHPVVRGEPEKATALRFAPTSMPFPVHVRLVGVPIDAILDGEVERWWPWEGD